MRRETKEKFYMVIISIIIVLLLSAAVFMLIAVTGLVIRSTTTPTPLNAVTPTFNVADAEVKPNLTILLLSQEVLESITITREKELRTRVVVVAGKHFNKLSEEDRAELPSLLAYNLYASIVIFVYEDDKESLYYFSRSD